jgi:CTP:molybdopterin cytidylyltransferase MocA
MTRPTQRGDGPTVAAVVLAAGAGTRMGGPKALLDFQGRLLVERAVDTAVEGGCSPIVVVLGAQALEVCRRADLSTARVVVNARWPEGMGSSLRAGLDSLTSAGAGTGAGESASVDSESDRECDAALVLLVDQPFIGAAAVRALLDAWRDGARLAAASYAGRRGHPVLFGREHWPAVAAGAVGDAGARGFLTEHAAEVVLVPCDAMADPRDLDTPEDFETICKRSSET